MGELSDSDFLSMNRQCSAEIETAKAELIELTEQRDSAADFKKHIDTLRRTLREAQKDAADGIINKEFVEQYIDKIFANPVDEHTLELQIRIFTGEITAKYLENLKRRTGHTFKKMIEDYENKIQ